MKHYYDKEFAHVVEHHQDEIMEIVKEKYDEDVFKTLEAFLGEDISERELVDTLKSFLVASAELVYEDHK